MSKSLKIFFLGLVLILYIPVTKAQSKKFISGNLGYSDNGVATLFNVAYSFQNIKQDFFELGFYSGFLNETETEHKIDVNVHTLNLGYFRKIDFLSVQKDYFLVYAGVGGVIGKETINNGNESLPNGALITSRDGSIYGGYAGVQGDLFLTDRFSLLARYTHYYHVNSEIGKSKFMAGLGLKYVIF